MTSLERVLTTLSHKEPDRVPFFLLTSLHGAKFLGLSIKEYFSKPEYVMEGQLRMRARYRDDCIFGLFYGPIEIEAWGGEVIFCDDGPPNSGEPFIRKLQDIYGLTPPRVKESPCLIKVLKSIEMLKVRVGDDAPIIGVAISPFSLPVMQMGFDKYIELMYENPKLFERLMKINMEFCIEWANAQLEAGAAVICYFDPVSSTTICNREMYLKTGFKVAKQTLFRVNGATGTHLASGRCLPIIQDIAETGTGALGVSVLEDLSEIKKACRGKLTVLGNLNGIEMRHWTAEQAESIVKAAIAQAGPDGGYILSDNHGEIPWQVPDEVLMAISQAVHQWGTYPLDWIKEYEK